MYMSRRQHSVLEAAVHMARASRRPRFVFKSGKFYHNSLSRPYRGYATMYLEVGPDGLVKERHH